jgi:hypothetical protein
MTTWHYLKSVHMGWYIPRWNTLIISELELRASKFVAEYVIMMANKPGKIQFISSTYPGDTTSAKEQRIAHSHAARTAHATARRARIIDYQASKIRQTPEGSQGIEQRGNTPMGSVLSTFHAVETEKAVLPSPITLLASDRRDPFNSFARSFEPIEPFLLDHCESRYQLLLSGKFAALEIPSL